MGWYSSLASLSFNTLENLSQVWHLSNVGIWEVMGDLQLTSMSRWSFRTVLADPDMPQSNKGWPLMSVGETVAEGQVTAFC